MGIDEKERLEKQLYSVLASIDNPEDIRVLLADLCTYNEIEQMSGRIECAKLLLENNTYSQIISKTDISSATLSRVSRCVRHGSGGYTDLLPTVLKINKQG